MSYANNSEAVIESGGRAQTQANGSKTLRDTPQPLRNFLGSSKSSLGVGQRKESNLSGDFSFLLLGQSPEGWFFSCPLGIPKARKSVKGSGDRTRGLPHSMSGPLSSPCPLTGAPGLPSMATCGVKMIKMLDPA